MPCKPNTATELYVLSSLRDFRREYAYDGLILCEDDELDYKELWQLIRELLTLGIIRGIEVEVFRGDEITKSIRNMAHPLNIFGEVNHDLDELENYHPTAYDMVMHEENYKDRYEFLKTIDTEKQDRLNGTHTTEELHELERWRRQFEEKPDVVGIDLRDYSYLESLPYSRLGYRVLWVDQDKLADYCKKHCPKVLEEKYKDGFPAKLSYNLNTGAFTVKIAGSVYGSKKVLDDGSPQDEIVSYIFDKECFGKKITSDVIEKTIIAEGKVYKHNVKELFKGNPLSNELSPFAEITKDSIKIKNRVRLSLGQYDKIKAKFKLHSA